MVKAYVSFAGSNQQAGNLVISRLPQDQSYDPTLPDCGSFENGFFP